MGGMALRSTVFRVAVTMTAAAWTAATIAHDGGQGRGLGTNVHAGTGYWHEVSDPEEIADVRSRFEQRLRAMGIPARVHGCRLMGVVTMGTASSAVAHGAVCAMSIGASRARNFWICSVEREGSIYLAGDVEFSDSLTYTEAFIRRTCW